MSRTVEIDGVMVPLSAGGASFTPTVPGLIDVIGWVPDCSLLTTANRGKRPKPPA